MTLFFFACFFWQKKKCFSFLKSSFFLVVSLVTGSQGKTATTRAFSRQQFYRMKAAPEIPAEREVPYHW